MKKKAVLFEAKRDGTNKEWEFKPQPFSRLGWLFDFMINGEGEAEKECRVTALLSGEVVCTTFYAFKLVQVEE